jgi:hypothetical protein
LNTTRVCNYWQSTGCNNEKCPFRHTTTPNCFYFSLGTCTKGGNCPFLHLIPKNENKETTSLAPKTETPEIKEKSMFERIIRKSPTLKPEGNAQ